MPQTLSNIKALLASQGMSPRKRFGQNFLHDHNKLQLILDAAKVQPDDLVLEVGPGTGALSLALLEKGARLIAVEIDRDLAAILRQHFVPFEDRVVLIEGDVLAGKHELSPVVLSALGDAQFKVVANLPYNVASPLMINLALQCPQMQRAVIMVQREVADRMEASPGGKTYGTMSVLLQACFEVSRVALLSPGCFWPQPEVESAVVLLERRPVSLCENLSNLSRLTTLLFGGRRKTIGRNLKNYKNLPDWLDTRLRPEQLPLEQFCQLAEEFTLVDNPKKPLQ